MTVFGSAGAGAGLGASPGTLDHGCRATSTTSGGSKYFPSKEGSIALMRSDRGGCVAQRPPKDERNACAKKKCPISAALWVSREEPRA